MLHLFRDNASSVVASLVSAVQSAIICYRLKDKIRLMDIVFPAVTNMITSTVCVTYGENVPNSILKMALGIFLMLLSAYFMFFANGIKIQYSSKNGLIAGALGGLMSSLFGAGGPPVSLYFSSAY